MQLLEDLQEIQHSQHDAHQAVQAKQRADQIKDHAQQRNAAQQAQQG